MPGKEENLRVGCVGIIWKEVKKVKDMIRGYGIGGKEKNERGEGLIYYYYYGLWIKLNKWWVRDFAGY